MEEWQKHHKDVKQNLIDAGCDEPLVQQFFTLQANGRDSEQLQLLCAHRKLLLDKLHECGRQLDCLDYLLYRLRTPQAKLQERCVPEKP